MHPVLFEISGGQVGSYGVCMVLGAFAMLLLTLIIADRNNHETGETGAKRCDEEIVFMFLICMCGAIAGAYLFRPITRIPELILNWHEYRYRTIGVIMGFLFGEIVFYGGLIGGICSLCWYCNKCMIPVLPALDMFIPGAALGHAFGRVGCYLGGCCYGKHVNSNHPFAAIFPQGNAGHAPPGVPLLATQLIEAGCLLIIAVILALAYRLTIKITNSPSNKSENKHTNKKQTKTADLQGLTISLYGILYGTTRFVLEFYRGDLIRGVYGPFSTSQYVSIAIIAVSIIILVKKLYNYHLRLIK